MVSDLQALVDSNVWTVFDIETDSLLKDVTRCHVIAFQTGEGPMESYRNNTEEDTIRRGLEKLERAEILVGHNIIGFDLPAIRKLYGVDLTRKKCIDTLVLSRYLFPNRKELDYMTPSSNLPRDLYGAHKLEAWGYRLNLLKGVYGKQQDAWACWTPELEEYNARDVTVTERLLRFLAAGNAPLDSMWMEMEVAKIIAAQERWGFPFDIPAAQKLNGELIAKKDALLIPLQESYPPKPREVLAVYKRHEAQAREIVGGPVDITNDEQVARLEALGIRFRVKPPVPFNPASRQQVAERFVGMGWVPLDYTDTGLPKVDEDALIDIAARFPAAKALVEYQILDKRIGAISGGDVAWLKMVWDDGRMHGAVNTLGANTARFTHSKPNMTQVPGVMKHGKPQPYGRECRSLFYVPPGRRLVGCDISRLELCTLAHYLYPFDGGEFVTLLAHGDMHTRNMEAAGLHSRDDAKTFIYAFLYGAGDVKLGTIVHPNEKSEAKLKKAGKDLRRRFLSQSPALARLIDAIAKKVAREKRLRAVDGRYLNIRSAHSALNTLNQSCGAIVSKWALVFFLESMEAHGLIMERDWSLVVHAHDEWQTDVDASHAELTATLAVKSIERAGQHLHLNCPVTGEAKIGQNWAETH